MPEKKPLKISEKQYQALKADPRPDNVKVAEVAKTSPDAVQGYRAEADPNKQGGMLLTVYGPDDVVPPVSMQAGENYPGESGLGIGRYLMEGVDLPTGHPAMPHPEPGDTSPEVTTDSDPMATPATSQPKGMTPEKAAEKDDDDKAPSRAESRSSSSHASRSSDKK